MKKNIVNFITLFSEKSMSSMSMSSQKMKEDNRIFIMQNFNHSLCILFFLLKILIYHESSNMDPVYNLVLVKFN